MTDRQLARARDRSSFLPLTIAVACPKARPQRGEQATATVRGRKTPGLLGDSWWGCAEGPGEVQVMLACLQTQRSVGGYVRSGVVSVAR